MDLHTIVYLIGIPIAFIGFFIYIKIKQRKHDLDWFIFVGLFLFPMAWPILLGLASVIFFGLFCMVIFVFIGVALTHKPKDIIPKIKDFLD